MTTSNTNNWQIGDILKVTQGDEVHYERVTQLVPEILTVDMNPDPLGDISTQGIANAERISYELIPNYLIAQKLEGKGTIPRSIAFSIANRFYGSDYNMEQKTFDNAAKELGY